MVNYKELDRISFPLPRNININMMPFLVGDLKSLPENVRQYFSLTEKCDLKKGDKAYLTITESFVSAGTTQRRGGIHTDGTKSFDWGSGSWGGKEIGEGIYLASSDGNCRIFDCLEYNVDEQGSLEKPNASSLITNPDTLYWITDRTPHEALPVKNNTYRQFFRVVANKIGVWWKEHSTENPFGILPDARIELGRKTK